MTTDHLRNVLMAYRSCFDRLDIKRSYCGSLILFYEPAVLLSTCRQRLESFGIKSVYVDSDFRVLGNVCSFNEWSNMVLSHCSWMCDEISLLIESREVQRAFSWLGFVEVQKAFRWLGFVDGCCWCRGDSLVRRTLSHCRWACDEALRLLDRSMADEAMHILGFIQGCCWCAGIFTISEMRTHSRSPENGGSLEMSDAKFNDPEHYESIVVRVVDGDAVVSYNLFGSHKASQRHDEDVSDWSDDDLRRMARDMLCVEDDDPVVIEVVRE